MIRFPTGFTPTKYRGYYFHIPTGCLYSCKSGALRKLKKTKAWVGRVNGKYFDIPPRYVVSHTGVRRNLYMNYLKKLVEEPFIFPYDMIYE